MSSSWRFLFVVVFLVTASSVECRLPEEGDLFEGDMILSPDQLQAINDQETNKNTFASVRRNLWHSPDGSTQKIIEYSIGPQLKRFADAVKSIREAIKDYEKYTCLRFKERITRPKTQYHMHFFYASAHRCFSNLGRVNGGNRIGLGQLCWAKGIAIHEMGHALGLFHEQSRPDRDDFITINWENINSGFHMQFKKYSAFDIYSYETPYDYESIMHYGPYAFATNRRKYSIIAKDSSKQNVLGQREGFSKIDIVQLNRMYCDNNWTTPKPPTLPPSQCKEKSSVICKRLAKLCDNSAVQKDCPITCKVC